MAMVANMKNNIRFDSFHNRPWVLGLCYPITET